MATISRIRQCPREVHASLASPHISSNGFTLIELLATMAVLVILSTIAATQLSSTVSNNRAFTAQTELIAALGLARSEAVRRGVPVAVSATTPVAGNEFGGGWSIWVDQNANGTLDAGETVLRTHEALPANAVTITASGNTISYGTMGFLIPAAAISMKVCPISLANKGYGIAIQPNGLSDVDPAAACP